MTIAISGDLSIEWWTADRSAVAGADYAASSWMGTFAGQQTFAIGTVADAAAERGESFKVYVQIVGHDETRVELETRILDDDATFSPDEVTYTYDVFNQLVRRTHDPDGANGAAPPSDTFYSHFEGQIQLQWDGNTAEHLSHRYLWNPVAVDQLLADEQLPPLPLGEGRGEGGWAGSVLWPLADHLGTIRDLATHDSADHVTTIANHRVYDSFGNLKSESDAAVDLLFGFTGRLWDDTTEQSWHLARWYDPKTAKWTTEDPIGFGGGDANLGRYVGNNPLSFTDPSGESLVGDYWYYLTHPWEMDDDLETGFYVAAGTAAVAGAAAGGLAVAGYGGLTVGAAATASAPVIASELVDSAVEQGLSGATGVPVVIPMSPADLIQDGCKLLLKRGAKESVEEIAERMTKDGITDCPVPLGKFLQGDEVAEAGRHAQDVGEVTGVVDRAGRDARRASNLKGKPKVPGKDLDEYPPAVIKPDDPSVTSVRPIDPSHNRRSGGRLGHELPPDGTRVRIQPPSNNSGGNP